MSGAGKACTDSSRPVTSFFKIMFGDDFSQLLFLPPKFARTVSGLVGHETILEDSCGKTWKVMISDIKGSLAFQRGWTNFVSDHNLEVGYFLVFLRTSESRFSVRIYDRTACEKLSFSEMSSVEKRKRSSLSSEGRDGSTCKMSKNSIDHKNRSPASSGTNRETKCVVKGPIISHNTSSREGQNKKSAFVSKAENVEEMDYLINRDMAEKQVEDRRLIGDSSVFEVSTVPEQGISGVHYHGAAMKRENEAVLLGGISHWKSEPVSDKEPSIHSRPKQSTTRVVNHVVPNSSVKECQISKCSNKTREFFAKSLVENQASLSEKSAFDNDDQSAKKDVNGTAGSSDFPIWIATKSCQSGKILKRIKEEPVSIKLYPHNQEATPNLGEEILPTIATRRGKELLAYSRKKGCQKSKDFMFPLSPDQSTPPRTKLETTPVKTMKIVKEEPIEIKSNLRCQESVRRHKGKSSKATKSVLPRAVSTSVKENDGVHQVVKTEVTDLVEGPSTTENTTNFSLLATCSQSFVELPECLPFPITKGKENPERKTVILRDEAGRLWPVLYHEKRVSQFLASGWEAFSKANCINSGDQCHFTVEDESNGIYSVNQVPT